MAVNETIIAITRTPAEPTRPVRRTTTKGTAASVTVPAQAGTAPAALAASAAVAGPAAAPAVRGGMGSVSSWSTEVGMALPSAGRNRATVQTDAVLHAPEAGMPVLLFEVDNCTESADVLVAKFDRYRRFFRHQTKDHRGLEVPVWRTLFPLTDREGHPPVAVVFNPGIRTGEQALKNRMNRLLDLTREVWSGSWKNMGIGYSGEPADGYRDYSDAIPLLITTLPRLKEQGPLGQVWWRCGHGQWETLTDALANSDDHTAWTQRDDERQRRLQQQQQRQEWDREQEQGWAQWSARMGEHEPQEEAGDDDPTPAPQGPRCEQCGGPLAGERGLHYEFAPPEDGRHCPRCRSDLRMIPTTLRQALFGRRNK